MLLTEMQESSESNNDYYSNTKSRGEHQKGKRQKQAFDPLQLDTIELARYVLGLLRKGVTTDELVQSLGRSFSLTRAFLRMFDHFGWMVSKVGRWILTKLGESNLPRFQA